MRDGHQLYILSPSVTALLGCKKPEPGLHGNQLCHYGRDGEGHRHMAVTRVRLGRDADVLFLTRGSVKTLGRPLQTPP